MQALDPSGTYTDAEVLAALTARQGTRTMSYRYDRLDSLNNYVEPVDWVTAGTITNNALADIKRTAKFSIQDRGGIDYLKDRIKPWARLAMPDGGVVEWPLGVFILASPERQLSGLGVASREVEAYDQLLILLQDKVDARYSVASGVAYTTAIGTLVATLTGMVASIVPSALTLPAALEWPPGTTKLRILNDLLAAINYASAWFDETGRLVCRPYLAPSSRASEYTYAADAASVIGNAGTQVLDLFDIPNKWVLVVSEADRTVLTSTVTNVNPSSPTSTVSRGRTIVDYREGEDAADQATLDAKAARYAFEASQVFEVVKFTTAAMPMHSNADVVTLDVPNLGAAAKYSEHSWELPLRAAGAMTHNVRRVVSI